MEDLGKKFKNNLIPIEQFVIYKQLNKLPHEYPPNTQAHACVALRLKQTKGVPDEQLLHHFINYIICKGDNPAYATRAYSYEEVIDSMKPNCKTPKLEPDYIWYANNQIINPVSRLLEYIEGMDMGRIADYIGIDKQKFNKPVNNEEEELTDKFNNTNFLYGRSLAKPLQWICTSCRYMNTFRFNMYGKSGNDIFKCQGKNCVQPVALQHFNNILNTQMKDALSQYYGGTNKCESCDFKTQNISMKAKPVCTENDCGILNPALSDKMINGIFSNWVQLFETEKLRKQNQVDDSVLSSLKRLEQTVSEVKSMSNFENLCTRK